MTPMRKASHDTCWALAFAAALLLTGFGAQAAELRMSGLKTYRTFAIKSAPEIDLVQFAPTTISSSTATVKCRAAAKRCIVRIHIEAAFEGTEDFPIEICASVDGQPIQDSCIDNVLPPSQPIDLGTLAFVTRKPGTRHKIALRVFSSAPASKLRRFTAEYTTLYK